MIESIPHTTKSEIEYSYPRLMINIRGIEKGLIVLFTKLNKGIVVHPVTSNQPIGHFSAYWDDTQFTLYEGEVVLRNVS